QSGTHSQATQTVSFWLKYGIDDIRLFYSNDLRFLRQF
ncbi:MAG: hypothetical protein AAB528_04150, partial [Chloroflexota bacterium]